MNKIERLKRIAAALTLASSVAFTTGCYYDKTPEVQIEIQDNHDLPKLTKLTNDDIEKLPNYVDECIKYQVNGENVKVAYKRENIMIVYNTNTKEYVKLLKYNFSKFDGTIFVDEFKYVQYYDLPTQELLVNMLEEKTGTGLQPLHNCNLSFYYGLKDSKVWKVITFDQLEDYTEDGELKDSYTEEQIDAIASHLIEAATNVKVMQIK